MENQEAARDGEVFQEHRGLHLVGEVEVVEDGRDHAEGGGGKGHDAGLVADDQQEAYRHLEQDRGPGEEGGQAAGGKVLGEAFDATELAETGKEEEEADEDAADEGAVAVQCLHCWFSCPCYRFVPARNCRDVVTVT